MSSQPTADRFSLSPVDVFAAGLVLLSLPEHLVLVGAITAWFLLFRLLKLHRRLQIGANAKRVLRDLHKLYRRTLIEAKVEHMTKALSALFQEEEHGGERRPQNKRTWRLFQQPGYCGRAVLDIDWDQGDIVLYAQLSGQELSEQPTAADFATRLALWRPFLHAYQPYSNDGWDLQLSIFDSLKRRPSRFQARLRRHLRREAETLARLGDAFYTTPLSPSVLTIAETAYLDPKQLAGLAAAVIADQPPQVIEAFLATNRHPLPIEVRQLLAFVVNQPQSEQTRALLLLHHFPAIRETARRFHQPPLTENHQLLPHALLFPIHFENLLKDLARDNDHASIPDLIALYHAGEQQALIVQRILRQDDARIAPFLITVLLTGPRDAAQNACRHLGRIGERNALEALHLIAQRFPGATADLAAEAADRIRLRFPENRLLGAISCIAITEHEGALSTPPALDNPITAAAAPAKTTQPTNSRQT